MKDRKPGPGGRSASELRAGGGSPGKRTLVQRRYSDRPRAAASGQAGVAVQRKTGADAATDGGVDTGVATDARAGALTDAAELLDGGARVEGGTLFSGPDDAVTAAVPSPASPDKTDDAGYEKAMGIDKAIAAKRMVAVAGVHGKTFTAVGCAGKKDGKVAFTFDRAFVGDYDYAPAGKPVRGAHVSISVSLSGCGEHTDVKLVQILRNFKKDKGAVVTVQPDAEMRKKRSGTDDPKAPSRGWRVDETETGRSPYYVTSDFYGSHGSSTQAAKLRDSPGDWLTDRNVGKEFRTCAVSYAGGKGTVLACVDWGYYIDDAGAASFYPATPTARVGAVTEFTDAVARWDELPGHTKVNLK